MDHPVAGKVAQVGSPLKFSETPVVYDAAPPVMGGDTADVLGEILDIDETKLDELVKNNVIQRKTR